MVNTGEQKCQEGIEFIRRERIVFNLCPTLERAIEQRDLFIKLKSDRSRTHPNPDPIKMEIIKEIGGYCRYIERNYSQHAKKY